MQWLRALPGRRLPRDHRHAAREGNARQRQGRRARVGEDRSEHVHGLRRVRESLRTRRNGGGMTFDVLVVGIGGQGVLTAADAVARAALACGYDATKTEVTGMSQRGGVVCSQVRFGQKVSASEIRPGNARLVIAFEAAEALRWSHYLSLEGWLLADPWR